MKLIWSFFVEKNLYQNADQIMEDEDKYQSEALIDRNEGCNRNKFKEMLRKVAIYPSTYSIIFLCQKSWIGINK